MHPTASMDLLGAILGGDRNTAITHRTTEAWVNIWSFKQVLCPTTLNNKMKLQRMRTEVVPVLLSGGAAWHRKEDALRMAESAIIRTSRIILHLRKLEEELWVPWHERTRNLSKGGVANTWGCTPAGVVNTWGCTSAAAVAACAASMVARLATRVARSCSWLCACDCDCRHHWAPPTRLLVGYQSWPVFFSWRGCCITCLVFASISQGACA